MAITKKKKHYDPTAQKTVPRDLFDNTPKHVSPSKAHYVPVSGSTAREAYNRGMTVARKNYSGGYDYWQRQNNPIVSYYNYSVRNGDNPPQYYHLNTTDTSYRWQSISPDTTDNAQMTAYLRANGATPEQWQAYASSIENVSSPFYNPYFNGRSTQDGAQDFFRELLGVDNVVFDDDFFTQNQWMRQYAVRDPYTNSLKKPSSKTGTTEEWMGYLYESLLADKAQSSEAIEQWNQARSDLATYYNDYYTVYHRPPTLEDFTNAFDVTKYSRLYSMDASRNLGAEKSSMVLQLNQGCNYSRESIAGLYNVLLHGGDISEDRNYFEDAVQYYLDVDKQISAQNNAIDSLGYDVSSYTDADYEADMKKARAAGDVKTYDTLMHLRYNNTEHMDSIDDEPDYIGQTYGYYYDDATIDAMRAQYAPIWDKMYTDETRTYLKKPTSKDSLVYHAAYQAWQICRNQEDTQTVEAELQALKDEIDRLNVADYQSLDEFKTDIKDYIYSDKDRFGNLHDFVDGKIHTSRSVFFSDEELDTYIENTWNKTLSQSVDTVSSAAPKNPDADVVEEMPIATPPGYEQQLAENAAADAIKRASDDRQLADSLIALSASGTVVSDSQIADLNIPVVHSDILANDVASQTLGALWLATRQDALTEKNGEDATFEQLCASDAVLNMIASATGFDGNTSVTLEGIAELVYAQTIAQHKNSPLSISDGVIAASIPSITQMIGALNTLCERMDYDTCNALLYSDFDINTYNKTYKSLIDADYPARDAAYYAIMQTASIQGSFARTNEALQSDQELSDASKRVEEKITQSEGYPDTIAVLTPTLDAIATDENEAELEDVQDFAGNMALGMSEVAPTAYAAQAKDLLNGIDQGDITSGDIIQGINNSQKVLQRQQTTLQPAATPAPTAQPTPQQTAVTEQKKNELQDIIKSSFDSANIYSDAYMQESMPEAYPGMREKAAELTQKNTQYYQNRQWENMPMSEKIAAGLALNVTQNANLPLGNPQSLDEVISQGAILAADTSNSTLIPEMQQTMAINKLISSLPKIAPYMSYDEYIEQVQQSFDSFKKSSQYSPQTEEILKPLISDIISKDIYDYNAKYGIGTERYDALTDEQKEHEAKYTTQDITQYTDPTEIRYQIEKYSGTGGESKREKYFSNQTFYTTDALVLLSGMTNTLADEDRELYRVQQDYLNYGKWFTYDEMQELTAAYLDGVIGFDAFEDIVTERISRFSLSTVNAIRHADTQEEWNQQISDSIAESEIALIANGADPLSIISSDPALREKIGYDELVKQYGTNNPQITQAVMEAIHENPEFDIASDASYTHQAEYTQPQLQELRKAIDYYTAFGVYGYDFATAATPENLSQLGIDFQGVGLDKDLAYYLDRFTGKQWRKPYSNDGLSVDETVSTGLVKGGASLFGLVPNFTRFSRDMLSFLPFVTAYQEGDGSYYDKYMELTRPLDERVSTRGTKYDQFFATTIGEAYRNGITGIIGGYIGSSYNAAQYAKPSTELLTQIADLSLTDANGLLQFGNAAIRAKRVMDTGRNVAMLPFVSSVFINTYNEQRNKGNDIINSAIRAAVDTSIEWGTETPAVEDMLSIQNRSVFGNLAGLSDTSFSSAVNLADSVLNEVGQEEISLIFEKVFDSFENWDTSSFSKAAQSYWSNWKQQTQNLGSEALETAASMTLITLLTSGSAYAGDTLTRSLANDMQRGDMPINPQTVELLIRSALYEGDTASGTTESTAESQTSPMTEQIKRAMKGEITGEELVDAILTPETQSSNEENEAQSEGEQSIEEASTPAQNADTSGVSDASEAITEEPIQADAEQAPLPRDPELTPGAKKVADFMDAADDAKADAIADEVARAEFEKRMAEDSSIDSAKKALETAEVNAQDEERKLQALVQQEDGQKRQLGQIYAAAANEGIDFNAPHIQNAIVAKQQAISATQSEEARQSGNVEAARRTVEAKQKGLDEITEKARAEASAHVQSIKKDSKESILQLLEQNVDIARSREGLYTYHSVPSENQNGEAISWPKNEHDKSQPTYPNAAYDTEYSDPNSHIIPPEAGEEKGYYDPDEHVWIGQTYGADSEERTATRSKQPGVDFTNPIPDTNQQDEGADALNPGVTQFVDSLRRMAQVLVESERSNSKLKTLGENGYNVEQNNEFMGNLMMYIAMNKDDYDTLYSLGLRARVPEDILNLFFTHQAVSPENLDIRSTAAYYDEDGKLVSQKLKRGNRVDKSLQRAGDAYGTDYTRIRNAFSSLYYVSPFRESEDEIILKFVPREKDTPAMELQKAQIDAILFSHQTLQQEINKLTRQINSTNGDSSDREQLFQSLKELREQQAGLDKSLDEARSALYELRHKQGVKPFWVRFNKAQLFDALDINDSNTNKEKHNHKWLVNRYLELYDDPSLSGDDYENLFDYASRLSDESLAQAIAYKEGKSEDELDQSVASWAKETNASEDDLRNMLIELVSKSGITEEALSIMRNNIAHYSRAQLIDEIAFAKSEQHELSADEKLKISEHTVYKNQDDVYKYLRQPENLHKFENTSTEESYYVYVGFCALVNEYKDMLRRTANNDELNALQAIMRRIYPDDIDAFMESFGELSNLADSGLSRSRAIAATLDEIAPMYDKRYLRSDAMDTAELLVSVPYSDTTSNYDVNSDIEDASGRPSIVKAREILKQALKDIREKGVDKSEYYIRFVKYNKAGEKRQYVAGRVYNKDYGPYIPSYNALMKYCSAIFVQHKNAETGQRDMDFLIKPTGRESDNVIKDNVDEAFKNMISAFSNAEDIPSQEQFKTYARAYLQARAQKLQRANLNRANRWRAQGDTYDVEKMADFANQLEKNNAEIAAIREALMNDSGLDAYISQYHLGDNGSPSEALRAAIDILHNDVATSEEARKAMEATVKEEERKRAEELKARREAERQASKQRKAQQAVQQAAEAKQRAKRLPNYLQNALDQLNSNPESFQMTEDELWNLEPKDDYLYSYAMAVDAYMTGNMKLYEHWIERVEHIEGVSNYIPKSGLDNKLKHLDEKSSVPYPDVRMTAIQEARIYKAFMQEAANEDTAEEDTASSDDDSAVREVIALHTDRVLTEDMTPVEQANYYSERAKTAEIRTPELVEHYEQKIVDAVKEAGMYDTPIEPSTDVTTKDSTESQTSDEEIVEGESRGTETHDTSSDSTRRIDSEQTDTPKAPPQRATESIADREVERQQQEDTETATSKETADMSETEAEAQYLSYEDFNPDDIYKVISPDDPYYRYVEIADKPIDSLKTDEDIVHVLDVIDEQKAALKSIRKECSALDTTKGRLKKARNDYIERQNSIRSLELEREQYQRGSDDYRRINENINELVAKRRNDDSGRQAIAEWDEFNTKQKKAIKVRDYLKYTIKRNVQWLTQSEVMENLAKNRSKLEPDTEGAAALTRTIHEQVPQHFGSKTILTTHDIATALSSIIDRGQLSNYRRAAKRAREAALQAKADVLSLQYERSWLSHALGYNISDEYMHAAYQNLEDGLVAMVRQHVANSTEESERNFAYDQARARDYAEQIKQKISRTWPMSTDGISEETKTAMVKRLNELGNEFDGKIVEAQTAYNKQQHVANLLYSLGDGNFDAMLDGTYGGALPAPIRNILLGYIKNATAPDSEKIKEIRLKKLAKMEMSDSDRAIIQEFYERGYDRDWLNGVLYGNDETHSIGLDENSVRRIREYIRQIDHSTLHFQNRTQNPRHLLTTIFDMKNRWIDAYFGDEGNIVNAILVNPILSADDASRAEMQFWSEQANQLADRKITVRYLNEQRSMNIREIAGHIVDDRAKFKALKDDDAYLYLMKNSYQINDDDWADVKAAIDFTNAYYRQTLERKNDVLFRNGMDPIARRGSGWFLPHLSGDYDSVFAKLGIDVNDIEIPGNLIGKSQDFTPGHQFDARTLERKGQLADTYDVVKILAGTMPADMNVIHQTDNVIRVLSLVEAMEGHKQYDEQYNLIRESVGNDTLAPVKEPLFELDDLGNLMPGRAGYLQADLRTIAQNAANKKTSRAGNVRTLSPIFDTFKTLRVLNMLGLNLKSSLSNFLPLVHSLAEMPQATFSAIIQTKNQFGLTPDDYDADYITLNSNYIKARSPVSPEERSALKWLGNKLFIPLGFVDDLATNILVRARYTYLVNNFGYEPERALAGAEDWTRRVQTTKTRAARGKAYENPISSTLIQFTNEAVNTLNYLGKDLIDYNRYGSAEEYARAQRGDPTFPRQVAVAFSTMLGFALANLLLGTDAPDPIGSVPKAILSSDSKEPLDIAGKYVSELASTVNPFTSLFENSIALIGNPPKLDVEAMSTAFEEDDYAALFSEILDMLGKTYSYIGPAGTQAKRVYEGIRDVNRGYSTSSSGNVRYLINNSNPISKTVNMGFATTIGSNYAPTPGAIRYRYSGYPTLSKTQSASFKEYIEQGYSPTFAWDAVRDISDLAAAATEASNNAKEENATIVDRRNAEQAKQEYRDATTLPDGLASWAHASVQSGDPNDPVNIGIQLWRDTGKNTLPSEISFVSYEQDGKQYKNINGISYEVTQDNIDQMNNAYQRNYRRLINSYSAGSITIDQLVTQLSKLRSNIPKNYLRGD